MLEINRNKSRLSYLLIQQPVWHWTRHSWETLRWHQHTRERGHLRNCNTDIPVLFPAVGTWRFLLPVSPCRPPASPNKGFGNRPVDDHFVVVVSRTILCRSTYSFYSLANPSTFVSYAVLSSTYYYYRATSIPSRSDSFIVPRSALLWNIRLK